MSTSVPNDNPSGTTAANNSVSTFLTPLISSLTRKKELVGYYNNNNWVKKRWIYTDKCNIIYHNDDDTIYKNN